MPTYKFDFMHDSSASDEDLDFTALISFAEANTEVCGWVIKMPFSTNSYGVYFCKDIGKHLVIFTVMLLS